jgi:hypothetical protein
MPARTEVMRCSPYPNKVNGTRFISTATVARCPQSRGSRGSRSRLNSITTSNATAPAATRPNAR